MLNTCLTWALPDRSLFSFLLLALFCRQAAEEAERQQALSKLESLFDFIVPLISFLLSIWHFAILIQSYNGNEFLEGMAGQPRFLDNVFGIAFA